MSRNITLYIKDILQNMRDAEEFIRGMDYRQFAADKKTLNAVVRSLEVMGEAAKRVPETVRRRYPDIPWKRIAGMRDKLIHEYSGVDLEIIWTVVKTELPPVKPLDRACPPRPAGRVRHGTSPPAGHGRRQCIQRRGMLYTTV